MLHLVQPGLIDGHAVLLLHGSRGEVVEGPQALIGEGRSGKADNGEGDPGDEQQARHDLSPVAAADTHDLSAQIECSATLMRDRKFHNFIIRTIILPASHDTCTRNSGIFPTTRGLESEGPPTRVIVLMQTQTIGIR